MKAAGMLLVAALATAACARLPTVTEDLDVAERRARLAALTGWDMRGRIAIDTGERAYQARFRWLERPDTLTLTVRGLFGAGSFEIDGSDEALTVRARGESWSLTDPEAELSELVGWWLPVASLDAWLVGLPDDAYPAQTRLDEAGRLALLEQRLWTVEYADYTPTDGLELPRAIDMRQGELRLRLTVDAFSPLDTTTRALN